MQSNILNPSEFDLKIKQLRAINLRMKQYDASTPMEQVERGYSEACRIYGEIRETFLELQGDGE